MRRRTFLRGSGAVFVVVLGAGVWRASDEGVFSVGEGPAYQPWKDWQSRSDGPLTLVELIDHERLRNQEPRASAQLAELTHDATWQPTFMFRIGYAIRPAHASPRRPAKDVIV